MTAVYLVVGAGELGWKYSRMAAATWLQLWITLGTGASLVLQRYVAEVEDS